MVDQGNMNPTLVATLCLHSRLRRMVEHRLGVGRTVLVIDSAMNSVRLDSMPRPILQGQFWPNRTLKCAKTYVTRWARQLEKGHFSLCPGTLLLHCKPTYMYIVKPNDFKQQHFTFSAKKCIAKKSPFFRHVSMQKSMQI